MIRPARHSRGAQISAHRRRYEREHGVTLTLICKTYDETHGFLCRSAFRYEIGRPGQVFRLRFASVNGGVYDARETFPTMAAAKAHVPPAFRTLSSYVRVWIIGPDGPAIPRRHAFRAGRYRQPLVLLAGHRRAHPRHRCRRRQVSVRSRPRSRSGLPGHRMPARHRPAVTRRLHHRSRATARDLAGDRATIPLVTCRHPVPYYKYPVTAHHVRLATTRDRRQRP